MKSITKLAAGLILLISAKTMAGGSVLPEVVISDINSPEFVEVMELVQNNEIKCKLSENTELFWGSASTNSKKIVIVTLSNNNELKTISIGNQVFTTGGLETRRLYPAKKAESIYITSGLSSLKKCNNFSSHTDSRLYF